MAFPSMGGNAQWILEVDIADNTGGQKTISFQLASADTEANAVTAADALIDAIEAVQPADCIVAARLSKPVVNAVTPADESQVQERLKLGFTTANGNASHVVPAPSAQTAGGTLVTDKGILDETNTQFVALKNLLTGGTWLASNGSAPTAYNGAVFEPRPGKNRVGRG